METLQKQEENRNNNELFYQDESWKVATSHKKLKTIPGTNAMKASETEKQLWLQDTPLRYSFSLLIEDLQTGSAEKAKTHIVKPPPFYIDAQIIDPLVELLNNTGGKENNSIKQLKLDQIKVQTNAAKICK
jgi:hypothetical protein